MIECKKILEEAGGDYKKALELISQADNEKAAKTKAAADHDLEISRGIAEKGKIESRKLKINLEKRSLLRRL
jgi:translation elongation factor EF-Ts